MNIDIYLVLDTLSVGKNILAAQVYGGDVKDVSNRIGRSHALWKKTPYTTPANEQLKRTAT